MSNASEVQTLPGGEKWMSAKSLKVYDCKNETYAIISLVFYSGSMGEGISVWSDTRKEREWKWEPIIPETTGETLWKIACGSK